MSPQPVTVDGHEIPPESPPGMGQTSADVQALSTRAEDYRQVIPHCHFNLTGRELEAFAANFPDGPVIFNFGDGTGELTAQSRDEQASATHTYQRDGVFTLSVRNWTKRWATEVKVNWPPAPPTDPPPPPVPTLTSLNPATATNDAPVDLRCVGSNFEATSVIFFNNIALETTVESPQSLMSPVDFTGVQAQDYPVIVRTGAHATDQLTFALTEGATEEQ